MILDKPMNVCVLVGSLRKASLNGMLANALISLAPSSMEPELVEIGQLPFYNQDLERWIDPPPALWTAFRQRVKAADAVLFVTPEYNRSVRDSSCSVEAEKGAPPSAVGGVKVGQPGTVFIMALATGRSIAGTRSDSHRAIGSYEEQIGLPLPHPRAATPRRTLVSANLRNIHGAACTPSCWIDLIGSAERRPTPLHAGMVRPYRGRLPLRNWNGAGYPLV
jgi:hypothetical protein